MPKQFFGTAFVNICAKTTISELALQCSCMLILNVLCTFSRNLKQPLYRVRVPPPAGCLWLIMMPPTDARRLGIDASTPAENLVHPVHLELLKHRQLEPDG